MKYENLTVFWQKCLKKYKIFMNIIQYTRVCKY